MQGAWAQVVHAAGPLCSGKAGVGTGHDSAHLQQLRLDPTQVKTRSTQCHEAQDEQAVTPALEGHLESAAHSPQASLPPQSI